MHILVSRLYTTVRSPRLRLKAFYERHAVTINLGTILFVLTAFAMWQWITVVVPAGHAGVKWHRFLGGTDTDKVYPEGTHLIWPWDSMVVYNTRLQLLTRDFDVLTKDGLMMTATIAAQFSINESRLGDIHKNMGVGYADTMLVPAIGSYARAILSQYSTDDIYTNKRMHVQHEIRQAVAHDLAAGPSGRAHQAGSWIDLREVLLSSMQFPSDIQAAINRKMEQYQMRQEYAYRLEREELESRRKEVEARGIAQFQTIVGAGISENYLRWKGIDATLSLARSPNSKVVVIGANRDGLPILLGGVDSQISTGPRDPSLAPESQSTANHDAGPRLTVTSSPTIQSDKPPITGPRSEPPPSAGPRLE